MDKKSKTVEMKGNADPANQEKLSYEQLEQVARDLSMQNRQLQGQLMQAQKVIGEFNDLGMLLSIVSKAENFSSDFIIRCTDRIEKLVNEALDNYDRDEAEAKAQAEKENQQES